MYAVCMSFWPLFPRRAVADPFLLQRDGKLYLLYETKAAQLGKGQIGVAVSSDGGTSFQHLGVALDLPWHLSYPFVFEHGGQVGVVGCGRAKPCKCAGVWKAGPCGCVLAGPLPSASQHIRWPTAITPASACLLGKLNPAPVPCHLQVYMLPEGSGSGRLTLYRATRFPLVWEEERVLEPRPLVDASLVEWQGRWYLLASDLAQPGAVKNGEWELRGEAGG